MDNVTLALMQLVAIRNAFHVIIASGLFVEELSRKPIY